MEIEQERPKKRKTPQKVLDAIQDFKNSLGQNTLRKIGHKQFEWRFNNGTN